LQALETWTPALHTKLAATQEPAYWTHLIVDRNLERPQNVFVSKTLFYRRLQQCFYGLGTALWAGFLFLHRWSEIAQIEGSNHSTNGTAHRRLGSLEGDLVGLNIEQIFEQAKQ